MLRYRRLPSVRVSLSLLATALLATSVSLAVTLSPVDAQADGDMVIEDNNAYLMAMGSGSRIELHGADAQKQSWTQLASPARARSNVVVVQDNTGWEVGDLIAVASTSNQWTEAEEFTIAAISGDGRTITLDRSLQFTHRAETRNYDNGASGSDYREWDVEIRAEVALLNRNITIQGDADSVEDGFGGHTMAMDNAELHIEGAEFTRMGQRDLLGRYPLHWHMLGQTDGQYVQNVSVHNSNQKGVTIHGTSNVRLEDSVVYDHVGHGVFLEDGSENDNQILGNLVFSTQSSETGLPIPTDGEQASSYWIENPNNVIIGNHAAGSESNGFWIFENQLHGESAETDVGDPGDLGDLIFVDNTSHTTDDPSNAGGSGRILGIDGDLKDDLSFERKVLTGDFGIVEGFTGYNGSAWNQTVGLVTSNSVFIDSDFISRKNDYIEDTLFDSTNIFLYRGGGNQYNNVHMDGGSSFIIPDSTRTDDPDAMNNVTGDPRLRFRTVERSDQASIVDIDGSISGTAGGFLTPGDVPFNNAPGAAVRVGEAALLSNFTLGVTEVTGVDRNAPILQVVRSDGESSKGNLASRGNSHKEFFTTVGMERDLAYLLDLDETPDELTLNLTNVREGDAAVYEIPGIAGSYRVTEGGVRVQSLNELLSADVTSYYRGNSSVFVRIVAVDRGVEAGRPAIDLLANYRAEDSITMDITGSRGSSDELSSELITALANSAPDGRNNSAPRIFEPAVEYTTANYNLQRYASGSVPVPLTSNMARWSTNIWGGNTPGADDIVVINAGQTVVLDESTQVEGIIVNGGQLLVEDGANLNIDLSTDYLLVMNGGLFQAGTETDLLETNFTLTLEGDDPGFDLPVSSILSGAIDSIAPNPGVAPTPAPVTPAPVTPAPVVPTPPAPVTPAPVTPAPVVPTLPAPTPPAPVTPAPVVPTPPAPTPPAPTPVVPPGSTVGVVLYQHCGFRGDSYEFGSGRFEARTGDFRNDVISSIKVAPGYQVEVVEHYRFGGRSIIFEAGEVACLKDQDFNDTISSVAVTEVKSVINVVLEP